MAINFPSPATHGQAYDFAAIRYIFDDGNAGAGYVAGEGWWYVGTVGSYGSCTGLEIDLGTDSVKFATPLALEESLIVKESGDGSTRLTYNGAVVAQTVAGGLSVPGTLTTQNLALLGDLTIPGTLFSGGVETLSTVIVDFDGVDPAGFIGKNDSGGFKLEADAAGNSSLVAIDSSGNNPENILQATRGGQTRLSYAGAVKLATSLQGVSVTGTLDATGAIGGASLVVTAGILAGTDITIDSVSLNPVTSQMKTTEGEAKWTKSTTQLELSMSDAGGGNSKTAALFTHAGATGIHYNGDLKLNTVSGGISVTGNVATGTMNATGDVEINSLAGSASFLSYANGGGIYAGNEAGIAIIGTCASGGTSRKKSIRCQKDGETALYHNDAEKFKTTATGVRVGAGFFIDTDGSMRNSDSSFTMDTAGFIQTTNTIKNANVSLYNDGQIFSNRGSCRLLGNSNVDAIVLATQFYAGAKMETTATSGLVQFSRTEGGSDVTANRGMTLSSDLSTRLYYSTSDIRLLCKSTGGVTTGTWTNNAISDPSVKTNILARNGIDNILKLNGVSWDWIDPALHIDQPQVGFLADNYQDVYPEQVEVKTCPVEEFIADNQHLLTQEVDPMTEEQLRAEAEESCGVNHDHLGKLHIINNASDKTFDADVAESIKFLYYENLELKERLTALEEMIENLSL